MLHIKQLKSCYINWTEWNLKIATYIIELVDQDAAYRTVSKSYTINTSGVWEYKTLTFPADTTGVLDNDNNLSMYIQWWLGAGLATDVARAEELAKFGVTAEKAREGYQAAVPIIQRGGQLAGFYGESPYTQATECGSGSESNGQAQPALGGNPDGPADRLDYAELQVSCDNRTDELRLLGNGVVPATAERAFRALLNELNT